MKCFAMILFFLYFSGGHRPADLPELWLCQADIHIRLHIQSCYWKHGLWKSRLSLADWGQVRTKDPGTTTGLRPARGDRERHQWYWHLQVYLATFHLYACFIHLSMGNVQGWVWGYFSKFCSCGDQSIMKQWTQLDLTFWGVKKDLRPIKKGVN